MRRLSKVVWLALVAISVCSCGDSYEQTYRKPDGYKEITFDASDKHKVYADFYPAATQNSEKVILMFHQAGSNTAEYAGVEPAMSDLGFNCIALDQRSGGEMWGKSNRTANAAQGDYNEAYNDLKGAVNYAESKNYTTVIIWGSSYSASLCFRLAKENPGIKGMIVFSPGEYFDDKSIVKTWAAGVTIPTLFACTPEELADGRQELYDAIPSDAKTLVDFPGGTHGSSTLHPEKSKASDKYLSAVKSFVSGLK